MAGKEVDWKRVAARPEAVKRYDLVQGAGDDMAEMVESQSGDWHTRADYLAMESRALAAEAEVERLRGEVKWQPMETAPKGRKAVLVYCAELRNVYTVWWDSEAKVWRHFAPCLSRLTETPTAWMPLPTPPMKEGE